MVCHNNVTILALCCFNVYIVWVTILYKGLCKIASCLVDLSKSLWLNLWHEVVMGKSRSVAHFRVETLTSSIYCTFVNALVWYWWDTCPRFTTGYGGTDRHCLDWSGWCRCCFFAPIKCCEHVWQSLHLSLQTYVSTDVSTGFISIYLMSFLADPFRYVDMCGPEWRSPVGCTGVCLSLSYVDFWGIWAEQM